MWELDTILTISKRLQAPSFSIQWASDIADTFTGSVKPAKAGLDLLGQLSRLLETRVQNVDLGSRLLIERTVATAGEADGHGSKIKRKMCIGTDYAVRNGHESEAVVDGRWRCSKASNCRCRWYGGS